MKKTNKFVLIVVLVLVIAFGVGQFFAFSNSPGMNSNVSSTTVAPTTQVVVYVPPALVSSTPTEKGSCWTNSIAAPYRADAWRCAIGNGIQDPCFQINGSTSTLLCGVDPARTNNSSSFALKLTKPLPSAQTMSSSTNADAVWLIELQDGTLCSPFEGTLPPVTDGGQTANYDCAPGPMGKETVIFGSLNNSSSLWTADVGALSTSTKIFPPIIVASSSVPVKIVWE
jgi:hypothetical protein